MNFLIIPANLEPKQLLIYSWLYEHSNQTNEEYKGLNKNEVYASRRVISKYTEIAEITVTRKLKELEKCNYIKCISKGKGEKQPSKYFLTFNYNLSKNEPVYEPLNEPPYEPPYEPVCEPVSTIDITGFGNNQKPLNEPVHEPVCEPVYEPVCEPISNNNNLIIESNNRINNIYIVEKEIFDYWNSKSGIVKSRETTFSKNKTKISTAIKNLGKDEILKAIDNLDKAVMDNSYYYNYKWNLFNFLKQANGISNWLEDGQLYNNYLQKGEIRNNGKFKQDNEESTRKKYSKVDWDRFSRESTTAEIEEVDF